MQIIFFELNKKIVFKSISEASCGNLFHGFFFAFFFLLTIVHDVSFLNSLSSDICDSFFLIFMVQMLFRQKG